MRVGLLAAQRGATGNLVTIERIRDYLSEAGHEVTLLNVAEPAFVFDSARAALLDCAIGLHALHAGVHLAAHRSTLPYAVVLGGTDVNEYSKDATKRDIMRTALAGARIIVSFHEELADRCNAIWPEFSHRLTTIHPAAKLVPCQRCDAFAALGIDSLRSRVFLLPCGIRPVKDPTFVVSAFSRWRKDRMSGCTNDPVDLVIIGPVLDVAFMQSVVQPSIDGLEGVHYHPAVESAQLYTLMQLSAAVVNTSVSEGLSNVLLEALTLGVPVIARRNAGNVSVVGADSQYGLLFETPEQFVECAQRLLEADGLRRRLCVDAARHAENTFSVDTERRRYQELVDTLCSSGRAGRISSVDVH